MHIGKQRNRKEKVYQDKLIVVSIFLAVISVIIAGFVFTLPYLKRTELEFTELQTDELAPNYATTETNTQQWDISATENDHVIATLSGDGVLTISGTGNMKSGSGAVIKTWDSVSNNIKSVVIENGVTSIGNWGFRGCTSLTSVNISSSVTSIKWGAFSECTSLTSMNIPSSVTEIGSFAFSECTSLTSINVDENNTNYMDDNGVLYTKDKTEIIQYPIGKTETQYSILEGVTSIKYSAFEECTSLTSINIPNGVTSIGGAAFNECTSLTSVNIPNSVTSIGYYAFGGCISLTSIKVDKNNQEYMDDNGVLYTKDRTEIIQYPIGKEETQYSILEGVASIEDYAFEGCTSLTSVNIPSSVTRLWGRVFTGCGSLTSINVDENNTNYMDDNGVLYTKNKSEIIQYPIGKTETQYSILEGVTSIRDAAFGGCTSLTSVNIPSSVTSIGDSAFSGCESLTSINIPEKVTCIGYNAFGVYIDYLNPNINDPEELTDMRDWCIVCKSLTSINVDENNTNYMDDNGVLYTKDKTEIIQYPIGKTETQYSILEGVTSIEDSAFEGCTSLTSINIPSSVTSIGWGAFGGCESLTSINIPSSVTSIGGSAFAWCKNLTSIKIPKKILNIEDYAFLNSKLKINVELEADNQVMMPEILKRTLDKNDILYTTLNFTLTNCTINEAEDKIKIDEINQKTSIKVNGGALDGLTVEIVPFDRITYSTTSNTKGTVTATLNLAEGETVTNNNRSNIYTFKENGEFTFKYVTKDGVEKTATAKVSNIYKFDVKQPYAIKDRYIAKVEPNTKYSEFIKNIDTNIDYTIKEGDKIVEDTDIIKTGQILKVADETYTIIVIGDLTGDGKIDLSELARISKIKAGKIPMTEVSEIEKMAIDVSLDGKIDLSDLANIAKAYTANKK